MLNEKEVEMIRELVGGYIETTTIDGEVIEDDDELIADIVIAKSILEKIS